MNIEDRVSLVCSKNATNICVVSRNSYDTILILDPVDYIRGWHQTASRMDVHQASVPATSDLLVVHVIVLIMIMGSCPLNYRPLSIRPKRTTPPAGAMVQSLHSLICVVISRIVVQDVRAVKLVIYTRVHNWELFYASNKR